MNNPIKIITLYVLEKVEQEKRPRKIELYNALAELAPTSKEKSLYHQIAADLAVVEQRQLELVRIVQEGDSNEPLAGNTPPQEDV